MRRLPVAELGKRGRAAVDAYARVRRLEAELDEARREHKAAVLLMPDADAAGYFEATEAMRYDPPPPLEPTAVIPPKTRRRGARNVQSPPDRGPQQAGG